MAKTCHGMSVSVRVSAVSVAARSPYTARVLQRRKRKPRRSPRMPKKGETSEPNQASAPSVTSPSTEPVAERTYQPRIRFSISNAHDVRRSAGHWKRKLRASNGARTVKRAGVEVVMGRADSSGSPPRNGETASAVACARAR
jgi:hypothetical protein